MIIQFRDSARTENYRTVVWKPGRKCSTGVPGSTCCRASSPHTAAKSPKILVSQPPPPPAWKPTTSPFLAKASKKPGPAKYANPGLYGAEHRVRTGDLRLGKALGPHDGASHGSSSVVNPAVSFGANDQAAGQTSQALPSLRTDLGPTGVQAARHLHAIAAPLALLSVRDVARILAVSTATVYALVDRGELPHVRVLNAIRVAPADLQHFIHSNRRSS